MEVRNNMKSIAELEAIKKKVLDNVNLRKEREEEEELRKARFEYAKDDINVEVDTLEDDDVLKVFKSHDRKDGI